MNVDQNFLVAIGASAGGLKALKQFVSTIPKNTPLSFLIIQHLDPTHESMLSQILNRNCDLEVKEIEDRTSIEAGVIYVIPPDRTLEFKGNRVRLFQPSESRGERKIIDFIFTSMSKAYEDRCAGILLSGAGSDGTAGLRAIKAYDGLALAQTPDTAEYESMPLNAINVNVVDMVLNVNHMYQQIIEYLQHPLNKPASQAEHKISEEDLISEISAILRTHEGFDLSQYKPSTVLRRIERRMRLTVNEEYTHYAQLLRDNADERKQLATDLLINVTEFFRDIEAFKILEETVIPDIFDKTSDTEEIRVWVPGCATGEEAYSIAILLQEYKLRYKRKNTIKIFATDSDEHAITQARKAVFSDVAFKNIPAKYKEDYFVYKNTHDCYQASNKIRDSISFAVQNIAGDPPFSRMHLISCRNLLIYLRREVQGYIASNFHIALNNDGYLFLGSSETIGEKSHLFKVISKPWRIFKKIPGIVDTSRYRKPFDSIPTTTYRNNASIKKMFRSQTEGMHKQNIEHSILSTFLPPTVIIDNRSNVIYNHGDWSKYMVIPTGEPQTDINLLIVPALRSRLRSAIFKAKKTNERVTFNCVLDNEESTDSNTIRVEVCKLDSHSTSDGESSIGIVFHKNINLSDGERETLTKTDETGAQQNLEIELAETKKELQCTIEELETSSEELKSSHEEALSTNEELQSTNEELEASAEELRSLNEELNTVNSELKEKIDLLQTANNDVENFFTSTNVPTIFLDSDFKIQRYTPAAEILLKIAPSDIGRQIQTLGRELLDENIKEECTSVLNDFKTIYGETKSRDNRFFTRQISPYLTDDRRIDGIVIVFQEITEIRALKERAEIREKQQSVVAHLGMLALTNAEPKEILNQTAFYAAKTMGADFCKILKLQPEENNFILEAGHGWREGAVGHCTVPNTLDSQAGYTMLSKEPVIVKNLTEDTRFSGAKLLVEHGVVSGISSVINSSSPPYGIIGVHSTSLKEFTREDANFLMSVAHMLSSALKTKAARESLAISESRYAMASNSAKIGILDIDLSSHKVLLDPIIKNLWGFEEDLESVPFSDFIHSIHEEDRSNIISAIESGNINPQLLLQCRLVNKITKNILWVDLRGKIIFQNDEATRLVGTILDITNRKNIENRLEASEARLRIALDTNRLGSFEYDIENKYTIWDKLLYDIWGVDESTTLTQEHFWEGVHPEDVDMVKDKLEKATDPDGDLKYHCIYRVINKETRATRWIEASGQTLLNHSTPQKMVGLIIDITESKELEDSLHDAISKLRKIDSQKNEFLSILGHELRNPLAAIAGCIERLSGERSNQLQPNNALQDVTEVMQRSVNTMSRLLDDLLDLKRVSQNKVELIRSEINVSDILSLSIKHAQNLFLQKNIKLKVDINPDLITFGDSVRVEQIFTNLITNACKYTEKNGEVQVEAFASDRLIKITFADNGMGISESDLNRIFEPFYQLKPSNSVSSGLGIGLALSKKLVELHGGKISAASKGEGLGSIFTVNLPEMAIKQSASPSAKNRNEVKLKLKHGLKVIIVEDNEDILLTLPTLLEGVGCKVQTANLAQAGLDLAKNTQPDAMLIDIGLPDMPGYDLAKLIRKEGLETMLIAVSGYSHKEAVKKSHDSGFDFHLAKPTTVKDITALLAKRFH